MPLPNFYHDQWPHPAPGNTQNPSMWMHPSVQTPHQQPPQPQYRHSARRMDGHPTHPQTPPSAVRLRTGSNYDPYAAEAEHGPYFGDEFSVSVTLPPAQRVHRDNGSTERDEYIHTRRDGLIPSDEQGWIRPVAPHDGATAQLRGRIEMLQQRIGAVERSREQEQRPDWDASGPDSTLPPAHQGVRWAYLAENRPGFWETGYGPQGGRQERSERSGRPTASRPGVNVHLRSLSIARAGIPPPAVVPPPESVPSAPMTGHKVYVLDCKSCGTFLSNRGMKAVLLLRPNIALFSTDAMPVNCSPQPIAGQPTDSNICDKHPQEITDMVRSAGAPQERTEEVLYARFFLPPKREAASSHPETATPETSADLTNGSYQTQPQSLPRTCECLTQTLSCHGCGTGIGYMIVAPCARCTAQQTAGNRPGQPQRTANGHRFVFHHSEIVARERLYVSGQPGVHQYPWGIPPPTAASSSHHSPTPVQHTASRARVASADSEPKSPSIPVFQPHRDGNFVPIVTQVPARAPTRRVQYTGLKSGDVVFWHHLARAGELGGVSGMAEDESSRDYIER